MWGPSRRDGLRAPDGFLLVMDTVHDVAVPTVIASFSVRSELNFGRSARVSDLKSLSRTSSVEFRPPPRLRVGLFGWMRRLHLPLSRSRQFFLLRRECDGVTTEIFLTQMNAVS